MLGLKTVLLSAFIVSVYAEMAPNYPEPGTIWKTGQEYEISWFDDEQEPSIKDTWKNFRIDFMTGDNNNQKFLKNVVKDLDASKLKTYNWTAPNVEPHSAIYFFMFTNEKGENAWTTRFAITGDDEKLVKPAKSVQSDGSKIPWGVGRLIGDLSSFPLSNVAYSMTPAMASAAENNAAVVIAVSSDSDKMKGISLLIIFMTLMASLFVL